MSFIYGKMLLCSRTFMKSTLGNTRCKSSTALSLKFKNIFAGKSKLRSLFTSKFFAAEKKIKVVFIINGKKIVATAEETASFLDVVKNNELNIPNYGVCDGALDCSTCMLDFKSADYKILSPAMDADERDLLDTFPNVPEFARLGCQVCITKAIDGIEVTVPETRIDQRDRANGKNKNGKDKSKEKNGKDKSKEKNGKDKSKEKNGKDKNGTDEKS